MCFEVDFISYKRTKCVSQIERGFGKKLTSTQDMVFGSSIVLFLTRLASVTMAPSTPALTCLSRFMGLKVISHFQVEKFKNSLE